MFYWLYRTRIGGYSYSSTTVNLLDFYPTKLSSIYRHKLLLCRVLGLDKTSSVAYDSGETQTCSFFFFYCSVEIDSGEILASVWQEEGNFEVLKRYYIQIYPTSVLLCFGKAANLQHMQNVSEVMWSPCKTSCGTELGQWYKAGHN